MARISSHTLNAYVFGGRIISRHCLRIRHARPRAAYTSYEQSQIPITRARQLHTEPIPEPPITPPPPPSAQPLRKQLKEDARRLKSQDAPPKLTLESHPDWELTVGIEIHAQLNTNRKLFSVSPNLSNEPPNTQLSPFDAALPGSMPDFQPATLIPAIRAAIALNCEIQPESQFDRKHYFHWDQPQGYQITQFYKPFAKDGCITLYKHDGIAPEDGEEVKIGIKQVQLEQDTAKTTAQPGGIHLIDLNRAGVPLIEIITLPQIHHPSTAAAFVRKVQTVLNAVNACAMGMESGGLRADVNVSVRRRDASGEGAGAEYAGVSGLGQRTEIKNLSSFKAVRDAILAERDRQISVLDSGGQIASETRGWTIGSSQTVRLRGKEGEVDYRYMPDPDLHPLLIGNDLVEHLRGTLGVLPDAELELLTKDYGLTVKDALSLMSLDDGWRAQYFMSVTDHLTAVGPEATRFSKLEIGKVVGNWVLHELGGLVDSTADDAVPLTGPMYKKDAGLIDGQQLARLIYYVEKKKITGATAKRVLAELFTASLKREEFWVRVWIHQHDLWFKELAMKDYKRLARRVMEGEDRVVAEILAGKKGRVMYLVGKMMRDRDEYFAGRVDATIAKEVLEMTIENPKFALPHEAPRDQEAMVQSPDVARATPAGKEEGRVVDEHVAVVAEDEGRRPEGPVAASPAEKKDTPVVVPEDEVMNDENVAPRPEDINGSGKGTSMP
jgi:aspartyl-tRNA(Asn)/glutamyl-tRNA(Gln) amidotransferase subunit B